MIFDPLYLVLMLPVMLLAMAAQWRVKSAYHQADRVPASMSGAAAARRILNEFGLNSVGVEETHGFLSDHYDPRHKVLRLSPGVYHGNSAAAVGIAAHEVGHAIQDAERYGPLVIRNAAVPLAATGGNISWIVFVVGLVLGGASTVLGTWLVWAGIGLFGGVLFFQVVNLPVEFDASNRAKLHLAEFGITDSHQGAAVKSVLDAAALTYVAATVSTLMTLVYMLIRSGLLGGRNN